MDESSKKKNALLLSARKSKFWTQEVASEKAKVEVSTYCRWESGEMQPSPASLGRLCEAFGLPPAALGYGHLVQVPQEQQENARPRAVLALPELLSGQVDLAEMGMLAFALAYHQYGWTYQDLQVHLEEARKRIEAMLGQNADREELTRRQAITLLSGLPIALLGLTLKDSPVPLFGEELLPLCATSIPACWELYFDGGVAEVERLLPVYRAKLSVLAQHLSAPYRKLAANFASQVYQLSCEIAKQQESFGMALDYCKDALIYAQWAEDPNLQVAALIRKADVYFWQKYTAYSLKAYEEALPLLNDVTPLLRGRVYAGLAGTYALHNEQQALMYMKLAQQHYPTHPEQDSAFPYTRHSHYSLYVVGDGLVYLNLSQHKEAMQAFTRVEKDVLKQKAMTIQRITLSCYKAQASALANDMEQSCAHLGAAALSAKTVGSRLLYNRAFYVYQHLPKAWYSEMAVKELEAHFQPW
jgi:transcriptional regulator with XRE-family HTH domain